MGTVRWVRDDMPTMEAEIGEVSSARVDDDDDVDDEDEDELVGDEVAKMEGVW